MGHIRHDAIVVTGGTVALQGVYDRAVQHFAGSEVRVSKPSPAAVNDTSSFLIAPDGSKEGWRESDTGDRLRQQFIDWLAVEGPLVDWIAVNYGGDESHEVWARAPHDSEFRRAKPVDD